MRNIARSLRAKHDPDSLYLLLTKRNSGSFTYDGIERGGERVCAEIEEEMKAIESNGGKITKLSVVGYSLGGLVSRYAVGLLYAKGILDKVECMVRTEPARASCYRQAMMANDSPLAELHHIRITPPRGPNTAQGMAQPHLERARRQDALHVRPPALHH